MKIDIQKVRESQIAEFKSFMERLSILEESVETRIKQLEKDKLELDELLSSARNEKATIVESGYDLQKKMDKANQLISESNNKIIESKFEEEKLLKIESRINSKKESLAKESRQLSLDKSELDQREKFIEMQERRLKFFEKNLNLVAQDKEISKKLKEIGGVE